MTNKKEMGSAFWIKPDGNVINAQNHIESIVEQFFDLKGFLNSLQGFLNTQTDENKTKAIVDYFQSIDAYEFVEAEHMFNMLLKSIDGFYDFVKSFCQGGFEEVLFGKIQPYHFAFKKGDIRARYIGGEIVFELDAAKLNRNTSGKIINFLFKFKNLKGISFVIDLIDFRDKEPNIEPHRFFNLEEFLEGLSDLSRNPYKKQRKMGKKDVDKLLMLTSSFYHEVNKLKSKKS